MQENQKKSNFTATDIPNLPYWIWLRDFFFLLQEVEVLSRILISDMSIIFSLIALWCPWELRSVHLRQEISCNTEAYLEMYFSVGRLSWSFKSNYDFHLILPSSLVCYFIINLCSYRAVSLLLSYLNTSSMRHIYTGKFLL